MKKIISLLLTASMLAGSATTPFTAIAAETATTASQASEAVKTGTLTVTVYNEDEGGLYTDEHTCFSISGGPDQHADPGMSGAVLLCEVKPSESNPFVMNDIYISDNFKYTIVDSGSPEYDGFHYSIDRERSDRTFRFTENPNQNLSIYMEKHYFVVNSNTNVTASTHGQDVADNMGSVMSRATELINSNDFKALDIADRISKAKELMKTLYEEKLIADYAFDAEKNIMEFAYKCGTITGQMRPAVFVDEHKQLDQKGTKPMALDDVKELAKKGGELTWSDFEAYSGRKCGTPFDMLAYIYEIDESYYLFVSGAVDGAPDKVQLCHYNEHISVDVLTGDVEAFIAEYSNYELPDIGYTFDEIYNMTEDEVRNVFNEKGLTATEKYHVYPQRNGNTAVDNDSMTILLYPENYMINLTGHELVSHVTDMNDRDKLFKDSDIVWDSEKVRKSLGLPEEYFNIYVESSMGVIKSAPEGEDPDIRKYCKCSIRCTSKDKDKIADLRRAALNYIQLNPDFALVYHETSGGENVSTSEKNLKGDANCDDQVDLSDAVMIMQALANPNKYGLDGTAEHHLTEQGKLNGDMNGDGLTSGDALAIQRKLLGLDDEEKSFSTTLLGIDKAKVIGVKVTSLPEGYDYSFTDKNAQAVVDYLSNISLSTNLSVEDPGQLNGMTWVIKLNYENGDTVTLYDLGKFIHGTDRKWYEMTYEESQELSNLIWKLGQTDNDKSIDNSAIAGKIFAYEKEGAGGYCTLSFNENGRFLYSPGKLSSYMGGGDWKIDGDTVSLIGMVDKTIYLKITDDTLVYIAESSDEFPYMDIKDGEKFAIYRPEISSDKFQLNSRYSEYGLGNPKVELNLIASELPEFCYVENVRLYDEDDNFIGMMSPAMDADIWSYLVDCNITEECSKTFYTLTKIRCGEKTYLDDVRSEITVNFKDTPAP